MLPLVSKCYSKKVGLRGAIQEWRRSGAQVPWNGQPAYHFQRVTEEVCTADCQLIYENAAK